MGKITKRKGMLTFILGLPFSLSTPSILPPPLSLSHTHTHSLYSGEGVTVSQTFHYSAGCEQQFGETSFTIAPGQLQEEQLTFDPENGQDRFPVVILMEVDSTDGKSNTYNVTRRVCQ